MLVCLRVREPPLLSDGQNDECDDSHCCWSRCYAGGGNSILSYKVRDHVTSLSAYVHQTPTSIASRGLQRQYVYHLDATTTFRYLAFLQ